MKKLVGLIFLIVIIYLKTDNIYSLSKDNKIVLLSSRGGYTHLSIAKILKNYLSKKYKFKSVLLVDKLFPRIQTGCIERFATRLFKIKTGDDLFNSMLENDYRRTLNFGAKLYPIYLKTKTHKVSKVIDDYIESPNMGLLISNIPFINDSAIMSAKKKNIPYLLICVDSNPKNWLANIEPPIYEHAYIMYSFDISKVHEQLNKVKWPLSRRIYSGIPIREEFYTLRKELFNEGYRKELRRELNIPEKKFTVMIMMGGTGSNGTIKYLKELIRKNFHGHVIIVCGRNQSLLKKIQELKLPPDLSSTIVGFTNIISKYMAVSDILLTKPGPTTFHEALQLNLPLLIENTKAYLDWEAPTADLVERENLGLILKKTRNLTKILNALKSDKKQLRNIKIQIEKYRQKIPHFQTVLNETIVFLNQKYSKK